MLKNILSGVSSGLLISIGGAVYLACGDKYVGSVLFTVALLSICYKGYALYTGKVGFVPEKHGKDDLCELFWALFGNTVATVVCGFAIRYAIPSSGAVAVTLCEAKLTQALPSTLIRGIFCGVLMYIAVSVYREKNSIVGVLFAIPVFIIAGFEHSIADIFYFAASGIVSLNAFVFVWVVILGNSLGAMILPTLNGKWRKNE